MVVVPEIVCNNHIIRFGSVATVNYGNYTLIAGVSIAVCRRSCISTNSITLSITNISESGVNCMQGERRYKYKYTTLVLSVIIATILVQSPQL